ncbi:iron uptake system protein EfeO [Methyloligella sp. 2.7D]|uniref:iron uptake system protein EfeO n=1 Tax=unclassified Methyloligella TaxID=2625955 RepID=UPI00157BC5F4|nr:iron uptake system protein EfeO [Methyloligella sp. GL2]QKP78118.1 iron uptake system protein EfeO [Methyloligella sp. GL2]
MTEPAPSHSMRFAVAGAALLAIAGGAAFYFASQANQGSKQEAGDFYEVTVTAKACEPNALTVPAGKRSFRILNSSDRPVEWEILDGVMVVEERENIAPGFKSTMTARLVPGEYEITCGLLSNPRGTLTVTPSEEAETASGPSLRALLGPLSEYKVYVALQSAEMVAGAEALAAAIDEGDLEKAQALYVPARLPYKRLEQLAYRFADLENAIDPVADYLEKREADAAFTGYHRIEYGLFQEQSLEGLAPVADKLVADVTTLKDRLRSMKPSTAMLTDSGATIAEQLAHGRIEAGENRYAHTDLDDIAANVEGIRKTTDVLKPVLEPHAPQVAAEIDAALQQVTAELDALKTQDGFVSYDEVDAKTREKLSQSFQSLAAALQKLTDAIQVSS